MSVLKTKPRWTNLAVATEYGWVNSGTGELLVSFRGLKSRLEKEELEMIEQAKQEAAAKAPIPIQKEVKQVKKAKKQIIAEVVEHKIDADGMIVE